jgi:hypothetical protein
MQLDQVETVIDFLERKNKPTKEQAKIISTATMIADQQLDQWLASNAPKEIRDLYSMAHSLTIFRNVGDYAGYTEIGLIETIGTANKIINLTADLLTA